MRKQFSKSQSEINAPRIAILWRGDEAERLNANPQTNRLKAIFAAIAQIGVDVIPIVYEDDVFDAVRENLLTLDGVLVWVNPIHEGRSRTKLDALLRDVAARGVWVSAHPDVILKMGTKEVLYRTRSMSCGSDTAFYRTANEMHAEFPRRLAQGPRVIKRNRGNGGRGVWKVETLAGLSKQPIVNNFNARYWEMYLTTTLILSGYEVTCPKPGPDVGIVHKGKRIWFECVSPTPGHHDSPDYVPPPREGRVYNVPNEKMVLRYLNSISEKYDRQYANWLAKGYLSKADAFVIAINPRNIPFESGDTEPPRILQAGYTVGPPYVVIDRATGSAIRTGYHYRGHIEKAGNADASSDVKQEPPKVTTGVFQDKKHDGLSALLCSRVDAANHPSEMGDDFQLAPNPHAAEPLPENFRLRGIYYKSNIEGTEYRVTPTTK